MELSREVQKMLDQIHRLTFELESWTAQLAQPGDASDTRYVGDVEAAYQRLKAGMGRSSDVLLRKLSVPSSPGGAILVACLDGIADTEMVDQDIIEPMLSTNVSPQSWDQGMWTCQSIDD